MRRRTIKSGLLSLKSDRGHPLGLRIDQQRRRRERNAIGHAGALAVQPLRPFPPRRAAAAAARCEIARSIRSAPRRAATHRPDNRRDCAKPSHSAVAAASLASPPPIQPQAKQTKATAEHGGRGARHARACRRRSDRSATPAAAKPATRISETRLAIVIVNRSLDAANAIIAGNNVSLIASVSMTIASTSFVCRHRRAIVESG